MGPWAGIVQAPDHSRCGVNARNRSAYCKFRLAKSGGVAVGLSESALTSKPLPGVENTTPRARPTVLPLKKPPGNFPAAYVFSR